MVRRGKGKHSNAEKCLCGHLNSQMKHVQRQQYQSHWNIKRTESLEDHDS